MRILLVDDDKNLSDVIAEQLMKEGFYTDCCYDGETGLHYALNQEYSYDIILLDRMLPILDGMTILKAMRQKKIATLVLMMTALGELDDKVEGLDCGADDYLVKPFYNRELLARIRALTRRQTDVVKSDNPNAFGLTLHPASRKLEYLDSFIILTPKEAELIKTFLEKPEKTYSRSELLWKIWGSAVEDGNVDNYIYFLRKRLRELGCPVIIKSVYGTGYRLEEQE